MWGMLPVPVESFAIPDVGASVIARPECNGKRHREHLSSSQGSGENATRSPVILKIGICNAKKHNSLFCERRNDHWRSLYIRS